MVLNSKSDFPKVSLSKLRNSNVQRDPAPHRPDHHAGRPQRPDHLQVPADRQEAAPAQALLPAAPLQPRGQPHRHRRQRLAHHGGRQ